MERADFLTELGSKIAVRPEYADLTKFLAKDFLLSDDISNNLF